MLREITDKERERERFAKHPFVIHIIPLTYFVGLCFVVILSHEESG